MAKVSIKTLLDAGSHFGHQTRRWNPKMEPYIFGSRGDIYIIDLKKTLEGLDEAYTFVSELAKKGGTVLFVGTKKQAQEAVADAANRCGMPYVNARWLGGMLTNFQTIHARVGYMEELEAMDADGRMAMLPKKEQIKQRKRLAKLQTNLNGIRNMKRTPEAVFVIDTNREEIAIREANRLGIPVVGTLDTNCDPDEVEYGIPANDDAIRSVRLLADFIADAIIDGAGVSVSVEEMEGEDAVAEADEAVLEEDVAVKAAEIAVEERTVEEDMATAEIATEAVAEAVESAEAPAEEAAETKAAAKPAAKTTKAAATTKTTKSTTATKAATAAKSTKSAAATKAATATRATKSAAAAKTTKAAAAKDAEAAKTTKSTKAATTAKTTKAAATTKTTKTTKDAEAAKTTKAAATTKTTKAAKDAETSAEEEA